MLIIATMDFILYDSRNTKSCIFIVCLILYYKYSQIPKNFIRKHDGYINTFTKILMNAHIHPYTCLLVYPYNY